MLAQNFKPADELLITEAQKDALIKTLVLLETGRLKHVPADVLAIRGEHFTGHFNMDSWCWKSPCGTVACIAGTAELIGNVKFTASPRNLNELFFPRNAGVAVNYEKITPEQAAIALRSYLTIDNARWDLALTSSK